MNEEFEERLESELADKENDAESSAEEEEPAAEEDEEISCEVDDEEVYEEGADGEYYEDGEYEDEYYEDGDYIEDEYTEEDGEYYEEEEESYPDEDEVDGEYVREILKGDSKKSSVAEPNTAQLQEIAKRMQTVSVRKRWKRSMMSISPMKTIRSCHRKNRNCSMSIFIPRRCMLRSLKQWIRSALRLMSAMRS